MCQKEFSVFLVPPLVREGMEGTVRYEGSTITVNVVMSFREVLLNRHTNGRLLDRPKLTYKW